MAIFMGVALVLVWLFSGTSPVLAATGVIATSPMMTIALSAFIALHAVAFFYTLGTRETAKGNA
jgi:hypothetical protein